MPGREERPFVEASKAPMESVRIKSRLGVPSLSTAERTASARARASSTVMGSSLRHGVENTVRQLAASSVPDVYGTRGMKLSRFKLSAISTICLASSSV